MRTPSDDPRFQTFLKTCAQLNDEEFTVVINQANQFSERILTGQTRYAPLNLRQDKRNWTAEAIEEAQDLIAYLLFDRLQKDLNQ